MPRRTRSVLIDATLNRIFTSVDSPSSATAANLLAGVKMLTKTLATPTSVTVRPAKNIGGGVFLGGNGTVASIVLRTVTRAPQGGTGIVLDLKRGTSNATATTVATLTLPSGSSTATITPSLTFSSTDRFYIDVVQSGTIVPGIGLSINFNYYSM